MSKILANQIANYGDDSPIELKEGLNIPAGKPLQAAGASGSNGQVLTSTGLSIQWTTPFDGDYNSLSNRPTIPAAQVQSDWNAVGTVAAILNKPTIPRVPSVTTGEASGGGSLSYSGTTGVFTFSPADLSSYLTSYTETDPVFSVHPSAGITSAQITNWGTAYGWGDHAQAGYLTGLNIEDLGNVDTTGGLSDQQVLKWDSDSSTWLPANDLVGGANSIALADLSVNTAAAGTAALSYNNTNGVFTFTPPDLSGYLTAETSHADVLVDGDFASAGFMKTDGEGTYSIDTNTYLTAETSHADVLVDGDFASAGFMKTDGSGTYSVDSNTYLTAESDPVFTASAASGITTQQVANWDAAHGWGDHAQAGYLTAVTATDLNTISIGALSDVDTTTDTPTTGEFLRWDGTTWKNQSFSGTVANATISDTAPGGATAGDLWWESDTGRLKIYYNDTDSTQWVDASPPLAAPSSLSLTTTNGSNSVGVTTNTTSSFTDGAIEFVTDNGTTSEARWIIAPQGSLIPTTNDAYDFGSAEYKVRDIYEADPSDARLKTDVVDYTGGLAFVESLRVVDFTWKDDVDVKAGKRETGLIAQEVKEALDASNYNSWRLHTDGDLQGVDKKQLIPALISAIQELSARVKELENK